MTSMPAADISTPCVKICVVDPVLALCVGCGRSVAEIAAWRARRCHGEARRAAARGSLALRAGRTPQTARRESLMRLFAPLLILGAALAVLMLTPAGTREAMDSTLREAYEPRVWDSNPSPACAKPVSVDPLFPSAGKWFLEAETRPSQAVRGGDISVSPDEHFLCRPVTHRK